MSGLAVTDLVVRAANGARPVDGVSFRLRPGLPLTLLGETGSGKTLVAQAVMGTLAPDLSASGSIMLDGRELLGAPWRERRALWGRRIALLPQEPWLALDPTMRAANQVEEVFRLVRRLPRDEAARRTARALATVGLSHAGRLLPFQLSGGMAQRLAIAATRAGEAGLLIADEPTKGLDAALRDGVAASLRAEAEAGRMVMTITHDVAVARRIGGAIAVMLDGRIVEHGAADRVLAAPRHDYARRLLAAEPSAWPEMPRAPYGPVVLAGRNLAKSYGAKRLFRGLDIALHAGETVAATGPSGAGKTTLGNVLLGLVRPDEGGVTRPAAVSPLRFQKLYQDPPSAFAPGVPMGRLMQDLARRHGLAAERIEALLARLRLAPSLLARDVSAISGGELQRFALARALLLDPVFLFADEATSRLDPITQAETIALLGETARARGLALLLVTHDEDIARKAASGRVRIGGGEDAPQRAVRTGTG